MEKINEGYCAELYKVDEEKLLKLYREGTDKQAVLQEYENTKIANELGIPSPKVYSFVEQEERNGFILEKLMDVTLLRQIERRPWKAFFYASLMAELHFDMHSKIVPQGRLQSQKEVYIQAIQTKDGFSDEEKKHLLEQVELLTKEACFHVCHGDFHPMNILFQGEKPVIIDWAYTSCGNPCADVAGTYMITKLLAVNAASRNRFEGVLYKTFTPLFAEVYLKKYLKLSKRTREEILRWIPIRAATYVDLGLPEEENSKLYRMAKELPKEL